MRTTQFTILQALWLTKEISQGKLGGILAMDSTTLTRTLEIIDGRGWIVKKHGKDRREWLLRLSKKGEAQFKLALPSWEKVQTRLQGKLGSSRWSALKNLTDEVTLEATD